MDTIEFEAKLVKTQSDIEVNKTYLSEEMGVTGELFVLIPLCFLAVWAIAILLFTTFANKKTTINLTCFPKVPCRNCKFFKDNPYLKCAVHPTIAMTEKAAECMDYRSTTGVS